MIKNILKIEKFDLLVSVYIFCILISEVMGAKTFPIATLFNYSLNASVGIFVLPLIFTINDIITEVFGKERTRSVIRSGLIMIILLLAFSVLATNLPPSTRFQATEPAYKLIFGLSIRFSIASLIAFTMAEFLDVFVYVKLRKRFGASKLWLRNNVSNIISQFVDTTTFMILAFYSLDKPFSSNAIFISGLILPYWLLKCSMSVIETPFVYLGVKWLKKTE